MANTSTAAGTPAAQGLIARAFGVVTAPRETFQNVAAAPRWFGILALTAVVVAIFSALPTMTEAGRQATVDQQVASMKSFGFEVTDEMYDRLERSASRLPYTTAISVIVVAPIIAVIAAGLLFAVFNAMMAGEASFRQVFAIVVHAGVISALASVFSGIINYFRGGMGSVATLGALLPMLPEQSFVGHLLGAIDVFLVWWVIVLAIGLAVLYRRRTQPVALTLLAVYAVIALIIAAVKSRLGSA